MKILIEKGNPTEDVARQFNFYYPYLKIEFYNRPFVKQQHATKSDFADVNGRSSLASQFNCSGIINISGNRTVRELESDINSLGIYGQILRKSGHLWIQTVLTNDWTLQHQNFEGEQISSLFDKGLLPAS